MARKPKREVSVCMAPSLETRGGVNPKGAAVSRPVSGSYGMLEGSHVPIQDNSPKKMLGGGNSNIFLCSTLLGEMIKFD